MSPQKRWEAQSAARGCWDRGLFPDSRSLDSGKGQEDPLMNTLRFGYAVGFEAACAQKGANSTLALGGWRGLSMVSGFLYLRCSDFWRGCETTR